MIYFTDTSYNSFLLYTICRMMTMMMMMIMSMMMMTMSMMMSDYEDSNCHSEEDRLTQVLVMISESKFNFRMYYLVK